MNTLNAFMTEAIELKRSHTQLTTENKILNHWLILFGMQINYKVSKKDFEKGYLKQIYDAFDTDNSRFSYSFGGREIKEIEFYYKKPNGVLVELKTLSMFRDFIEKDRVGFVIE